MSENLDDLTPEERKRYLDWKARYGALAIDLSTAYIKNRLCVSFRTAEKNYVKGQVGSYWVMVAELVNRTISDQDATDAFHNLLVELRHMQDKRGN